MSTYVYRFVGWETLPARLTVFDLQHFCLLGDGDVQAIRQRIRSGQGLSRRLRDLDQAAESALVAMLAIRACEAPHPDDLVSSACHWLYDRRILIPDNAAYRTGPGTRSPQVK